MTPPFDSVNPEGRFPDETLHVYGAVPPDAANVIL
jgi:hypothetical protein